MTRHKRKIMPSGEKSGTKFLKLEAKNVATGKELIPLNGKIPIIKLKCLDHEENLMANSSNNKVVERNLEPPSYNIRNSKRISYNLEQSFRLLYHTVETKKHNLSEVTNRRQSLRLKGDIIPPTEPSESKFLSIQNKKEDVPIDGKIAMVQIERLNPEEYLKKKPCSNNAVETNLEARSYNTRKTKRVSYDLMHNYRYCYQNYQMVETKTKKQKNKEKKKSDEMSQNIRRESLRVGLKLSLSDTSQRALRSNNITFECNTETITTTQTITKSTFKNQRKCSLSLRNYEEIKEEQNISTFMNEEINEENISSYTSKTSAAKRKISAFDEDDSVSITKDTTLYKSRVKKSTNTCNLNSTNEIMRLEENVTGILENGYELQVIPKPRLTRGSKKNFPNLVTMEETNNINENELAPQIIEQKEIVAMAPNKKLGKRSKNNFSNRNRKEKINETNDNTIITNQNGTNLNETNIINENEINIGNENAQTPNTVEENIKVISKTKKGKTKKKLKPNKETIPTHSNEETTKINEESCDSTSKPVEALSNLRISKRGNHYHVSKLNNKNNFSKTNDYRVEERTSESTVEEHILESTVKEHTLESTVEVHTLESTVEDNKIEVSNVDCIPKKKMGRTRKIKNFKSCKTIAAASVVSKTEVNEIDNENGKKQESKTKKRRNKRKSQHIEENIPNSTTNKDIPESNEKDADVTPQMLLGSNLSVFESSFTNFEKRFSNLQNGFANFETNNSCFESNISLKTDDWVEDKSIKVTENNSIVDTSPKKRGRPKGAKNKNGTRRSREIALLNETQRNSLNSDSFSNYASIDWVKQKAIDWVDQKSIDTVEQTINWVVQQSSQESENNLIVPNVKRKRGRPKGWSPKKNGTKQSKEIALLNKTDSSDSDISDVENERNIKNKFKSNKNSHTFKQSEKKTILKFLKRINYRLPTTRRSAPAITSNHTDLAPYLDPEDLEKYIDYNIICDTRSVHNVLSNVMDQTDTNCSIETTQNVITYGENNSEEIMNEIESDSNEPDWSPEQNLSFLPIKGTEIEDTNQNLIESQTSSNYWDYNSLNNINEMFKEALAEQNYFLNSRKAFDPSEADGLLANQAEQLDASAFHDEMQESPEQPLDDDNISDQSQEVEISSVNCQDEYQEVENKTSNQKINVSQMVMLNKKFDSTLNQTITQCTIKNFNEENFEEGLYLPSYDNSSDGGNQQVENFSANSANFSFTSIFELFESVPKNWEVGFLNRHILFKTSDWSVIINSKLQLNVMFQGKNVNLYGAPMTVETIDDLHDVFDKISSTVINATS